MKLTGSFFSLTGKCCCQSRHDFLAVLRLFRLLFLHQIHPVPLGMSIRGIPVTWLYWEAASHTGAELQLPPHANGSSPGPLIPITLTQSNLLLLLCSPHVGTDLLLLFFFKKNMLLYSVIFFFNEVKKIPVFVPLWMWKTNAGGVEANLIQANPGG